ncbi:MAG: GMC family oxidoreductase, partial [Bacteroidota bacterium]
KELCEKGMKTLVLERGRNVEHGTDYVTEHKPPWEYPLRGQVAPAEASSEHEVQRECYAFNETTKHFFINDRQNPYIQDKPFHWIRGNHVGGRSLMWGRQCYRWSDLDFQANAKEDIGVPWPIGYDDIAPWYDYVETFAGISGEALGLPYLPDSVFQKPMALSAGEQVLKAGIESAFPGRVLTVGRVAVLTEALNGRAACHYCGPCQRGCSTGSYFSSQSATLPAAVATGNMTLRPDSHVHSVIYDEATGRATGVRVVDAHTKEMVEYEASVVFLCASTLGSTQIMLNSKSASFPDGIANSSGALGHYLMDHHYQVSGRGRIEGLEDKYHYGNRPNGFYIPRFRNLDEATKRDDYVRGYGIQGSVHRGNWGRGYGERGFGAEFKESLRTPGPWALSLNVFGETLPDYANRVWLDPDQTDAWGIPLLHIDCEWKENELAMRKDMEAGTEEMLLAAGVKDVSVVDRFMTEGYGVPGLGIHEMGTARMGDDPNTSVLNGWNQAHDVPNLFVTDGACMTSSACQNPSITYMALTARAVDYAAGEMKKGNL